MSHRDLGGYAFEYQAAVNLLIENMIKTRQHNFMVYPIIFLFRHYIELRLKEIILNIWNFLDIVHLFPSRVLKNPVLTPNNLSSRHEIGVDFHLFTPFSAPC